jgi:hypothetical protein
MDWTFSNVSFVKKQKEHEERKSPQIPIPPVSSLFDDSSTHAMGGRRQGREYIPRTVSVCQTPTGYVTHWKIENEKQQGDSPTTKFRTKPSNLAVPAQIRDNSPTNKSVLIQNTTPIAQEYYYSQPQDVSTTYITEDYQDGQRALHRPYNFHEHHHHYHDPSSNLHSNVPHYLDYSTKNTPKHERSHSAPATLFFRGHNFHYVPATASQDLVEHACGQFLSSQQMMINSKISKTHIVRHKLSIKDLLQETD